MVHPTPKGLARHRHSAFRQQILDVAQAEGEAEVKPYRLLNDLGRETIAAVADLVHPRGATRPLHPRGATRPPRMPQARSAVTMPLREEAVHALKRADVVLEKGERGELVAGVLRGFLIVSRDGGELSFGRCLVTFDETIRDRLDG